MGRRLPLVRCADRGRRVRRAGGPRDRRGGRVGGRARAPAPGVGQRPEQHQGHHDHQRRRSSPASMVHRVECQLLRTARSKRRSTLDGGARTVPVLRPRIVEDQGRVGVGEIITPPDRHRWDRSGCCRPRTPTTGSAPPGLAIPVRGGGHSGFCGRIGLPQWRHRRWIHPVGQVLQRAEGRVVAPDGVQVIATRASEQPRGENANGDQHHCDHDEPHHDHSTPKRGPIGQRRPDPGRPEGVLRANWPFRTVKWR